MTATPIITLLSTTALKAYESNAKLHPKKQVQQIANSIREFGFINPIIIDANNVIIAGHGRFEAAKQLGLEKVPTIAVHHLSKAQERAYRLADNKLAMNSGFDDDLIKVELGELAGLDLGFDLEVTGFETAELDILYDGTTGPKPDPADSSPPVELTAVAQLGDVFLLGERFVDMAILSGKLTVPEAEINPMSLKKAGFQGPTMPWIDPQREVTAEEKAVQSGFKSRTQVIRERGGNPQDIFEQIKQEREQESEAGISFTSSLGNQKHGRHR